MLGTSELSEVNGEGREELPFLTFTREEKTEREDIKDGVKSENQKEAKRERYGGREKK